jgi:hypothetical protein
MGMRLIDAAEARRNVEAVEMTVIAGRMNGKTVMLKSLREYRDAVLGAIESTPTVDPVAHARWKLWSNNQPCGASDYDYFCSACSTKRNGTSPYCSACGARMDGAK